MGAKDVKSSFFKHFLSAVFPQIVSFLEFFSPLNIFGFKNQLSTFSHFKTYFAEMQELKYSSLKHFIIKFLSVTEHEFRPGGEVELSKDNVVWTVLNWGYDFLVEFDAKVNSEIPHDWSNIFHMTTLDDGPRLRLPSFMVWNVHKKFEVCFSVNGNDSYCVYQDYRLNQWYHFQISQVIIPTGGAQYKIRVNCNTVHEILNSQPRNFLEAKFYLSSPWRPSVGLHGTLSNLRITKEG